MAYHQMQKCFQMIHLYFRLRFNNSIVLQSPYQKHPGIFLDARLTFEKHLKVINTKGNKTIGLFWGTGNFAYIIRK